MSCYFAFLRGINVGGHRVSMGRLRELFEECGFANVATYIASGNVIFETPGPNGAALEGRIEAHLGAGLGYEVPTFLRTPGELATVATLQPFGELAAGHTLHVGFLRGTPGPGIDERLATFHSPEDGFRVLGRELYWLSRVRVSDSTVPWPRLAKAVGVPSTLRNMNTVKKLAHKYPSA